MNSKFKQAIDTTQRAQRNYDLSKDIPQEDLETLIYAAVNSPSKQSETHYSLYVYTDQSIIRQIYNTTQRFTLGINEAIESHDGEEWLYKNRSVKNSQILSNALFVYVEDEGPARGATHLAAQNNMSDEQVQELVEQKNYSIGISTGELLLSAALLGYKTGLCSAFPKDKVGKIIGSKYDPKLLVGIGYENAGTDRRLHSETLNSDIPKTRRTGELDEHWKFPTFKKYTKVTINGINT